MLIMQVLLSQAETASLASPKNGIELSTAGEIEIVPLIQRVMYKVLQREPLFSFLDSFLLIACLSKLRK